jgi:DNA-binding PadR family transcriptional regulator
VLQTTCRGHFCTCVVGNVFRFVEPVVLRILRERKGSYGYEIAEYLAQYALTDATIKCATLYRTLRTVESNWNGPSRGRIFNHH